MLWPSSDWALVRIVGVKFAIDAKNCDISVGGIGTSCDAYQISMVQPHLQPIIGMQAVNTWDNWRGVVQ